MTDTENHTDAAAERAAAWAASGMAGLTGRPDGPGLGAPATLVEGVEGWAEALASRSGELGRAVLVDPLALLAERAAVTGLVRRGQVSCGGGSRLLPCADGWVAASLSRTSDWESVAAWLGRPRAVPEGAWGEVGEAVSGLDAGDLRDRAALVGLPVAVMGERRWLPGRRDALPPGAPEGVDGNDGTDGTDGIFGIRGIHARRIRPTTPVRSCADLVVVDLSSLWAGPLVGRLLGRAGARVVKVESTARPDGARAGSPRFFGLLNGGKESVALDFTSARGRGGLAAVVAAADVVITGSRPRALEQLGLDVEALVRDGRPRVWLSVTGYGATGASGQRVAFGDDAAVAGGLVAADRLGPCFCGDAIADPLSGLASTVAVLGALGSDGAWVIDASMSDIAGGVAGPMNPVALTADPPSPDPDHDPVIGPGRRPHLVARTLGADTVSVLAGLGGP